jgi:hypothetical protein
MEIPELRGRAFTALDALAAPGQWLFRFGEESSVNVECDWRIVSKGRVVLAAKDHRQLFGRQELVDVAREATALLGGKKVARASLDQTGDLLLELEDSTQLETFTDSSGYESCTIRLADGRQFIVLGGGEVAKF